MKEARKAFDRIAVQLEKLIALSGCSRPGRAAYPVVKSTANGPQYHLLHSMTWDENGELDIR